MHSSLTRASRLANSQASASNAGVPGDLNSPEFNCFIPGPDFIRQGVVLLVCLLHSHQVDWFGHDGYTVNSLI